MAEFSKILSTSPKSQADKPESGKSELQLSGRGRLLVHGLLLPKKTRYHVAQGRHA
jgi:hypothetical protein